MPNSAKQIVVIGGGPAGYSAAIRASQLGARVTLLEKGELGGACLNWACIPTKTALHSLDLLRSIKKSGIFGVSAGQPYIDLSKLRSRKESVVSMLKSGVEQLLTENSVEIIRGEARLRSPNNIEVFQTDGTRRSLKSETTIIATGSSPNRLLVPGVDAAAIMYPRDLLEFTRAPKSLIMVGGGAVGLEMAYVLNELGCRVTILELMSHILSSEDIELTQILERALIKDGIRFFTSAQITSVVTETDAMNVNFRCGGIVNELEAETICTAIGQKPNVEGLGLTECGVKISGQGIDVDEHMLSSLPSIFAAGDVTGKAMLAYVATAQGRVAAENAMDMKSVMDYSAVPHCVFTTPELASVGLTEAEARANGLKIRCLRSNMAANASATILGERRGMVKIVTDAGDGRILGAHILGIDASHLIAECTLAINLRASVTDLAQTLHLHPTLSETIWETALTSLD